MGAGESKTKVQKINDYNTFVQVMDVIASEYILTMNFSDMLELQNPEKSKNILILTQDIIMKELEKHDLIYDKKMQDAMGNTKKQKESVVFTATKDELDGLKLNATTHQTLANALARKYLKIANIFAAIFVVLHPEYETKVCKEVSETTSNGTKNKKRICNPYNERKSKKKKGMYFMQKNPEEAPIENFCHKRLQTLIGKGTSELNANLTKGITVAPTVCKFGKNLKEDKPLKFSEEPGILELDALYYDEYDEQTKDFTKRSPAMEKELKKDATALFEAIVGSSLADYNKMLKQNDPQALPKVINSFDDITMETLYNSEGCLPVSDNIASVTTLEQLQTSGIGSFRQKYTGNTELFRQYGAHLKTMNENAKKNYLALSNIIEIIFVQSDNKYRIRQGIKETEINKLLEETRKLISKMYIQCSEDFRIGITLFKKIVAETISNQHKKIMDSQKHSLSDAMKIANKKVTID